MKPLIKYVNDLFNKYGSDYRIEKELGLAKGAVYKIKHRQQCGKNTAIKIADSLGVNREEVIMAAEIAKHESAIKRAMENLSKNGSQAANLFLAVGIATPALVHGIAAKFGAVLCILCKIAQSGKWSKFIAQQLSILVRHGFFYVAPRSRFKSE